MTEWGEAMQQRKLIFGTLVLAAGVLTNGPASAIVVTSFGPFGEAGTSLDPDRNLFIGPGGVVFELDAFFGFGGGPNLQLSAGGLPAADVGFTFEHVLSDSDTDLTLTYTFTNNTGSILDDVQFISYLDAEIVEMNNTFFNEYGLPPLGVPGTGPGDLNPDSWEIDEPGFRSPNPGDIFDNAGAGTLDSMNAVPLGMPDDVAMALGFLLGSLDPGGSVSIRILLSEDFDQLGSLALVHQDLDSEDTVITMSGQVVPTGVPEPGTLVLLGMGLAALAAVRRSRAG